MTAVVEAERFRSELAHVRDRIRRAGGDPARVRVMAVTKGFGPEAVDLAVGEGLDVVGENYAQELADKARALRSAGSAAARAVRWHFIGALQRNKVRLVAPLVARWDAVDRIEVGNEIARRAAGARVLVQVKMSEEPSKSGCPPHEAPELVEALKARGLCVEGLMCVAPATSAGSPEAARPAFRALADLGHRLGLDELSMGMSADLEVAVQEGATMVRVGTALFGSRPVHAKVASTCDDRLG